MSGNNNREEKENRKAICAGWTILFVVCMAAMLLFAANKTIVIADVSQEQSGLSVNSAQGNQQSEDRELRVSKTYGVEKSFCVPLPKGVKAENVVMENRYIDRELWLYIQGGDAGFYEENAISGDISPVLSGRSEEQEDGILLKICMNQVLEYRSTMEGNNLTIAWFEPEELYEYIVVLDTADGKTEQEREPALQVARQVQKKITLENVRLYLLGSEDRDVTLAERLSFAEEVRTDLYIGIRTAYTDNPETYGICGFYNEEFFIPEFGNVDLADLVTREVTIAAGNRAAGFETAGEESILRSLQMPSAEVSLGYLSNPKEKYLLEQETYREKLADGIVSAVSKATDALKNKENIN